VYYGATMDLVLIFGPRVFLRMVPWNCTTAEYIAPNRVTFQYKSRVLSSSYFSYLPRFQNWFVVTIELTSIYSCLLY